MTEHQSPNTGAAKNEESLGLAGRMARAFIHSPLSPLLFFAMLAMGVLGLVLTPRQEDPQISVPMVDIFVEYPGASSEQVASLAIDPLQRIMSEIPGIKHVYSASRRGEGMVTVQFDVGEQFGPSIVKVHDKLQSNLDKIPPGVSMPLVKPKGIDDVPVVTLTLWSEDVDDGILRTLALDVLQSLKQIPNTGQGFVVGGRAEQVRVEVVPERLAGYGISLEQVANTIQTANSEKRAGNIERGGSFFTVYTGSFLHSAEDIARLVVSVDKGVPVYVRDLARVSQAPEEPRQAISYYTGAAGSGEGEVHGAPAVTLALAKKEGTNGVTVAESIIDKVENLKGQLIPDNVNIAITRNYGETANDKVNELIFKLFVATAAVAILVWLALGLRPAMVVLFVIPVVILITVFSAWILGFTIDRVSLFALIFSIGILVDDAIVVIENIYRRWLLKGEMDTATAVDAVREVGNPTILATFTVIAALLPMGFVSGMMGPYMAPIPALGSVAMIFSLFAAFIFTPWLAMRIRPSMAYLQRAEVREHRQNEKLERMFRRVLTPIIDNKLVGWSVLGSIVVVFFACCAMFYTTAVTVKMLPYDNKPEFSVTVDLPEGSALPMTANLVHGMAEALRDMPEVTAIQTYAGTAQPFDFNGMVRHYYLRQEPWQAELHVQLLHKSDRSRSSHEIALQARELLTPMAREMGARITVVEMPPGPPVLQSIVAEVYGPDAATRRDVARRITDAFEQAEGVADVDTYMQGPFDVWRFEVDTEKAVRRGISVDAINRNLAMAMGGFRLGDVKQGTVLDPTYIVMEMPLAIRAEVARLGDLPIMAPDGGSVPLAELGRFYRMTEDPIVYHKDLRPVEYVVGDAVGRLAAPIYGMSEVESILESYVTPDGVPLKASYIGPPADNGHSGFEWTGEWTVTYETFRDMGAAFGVALVLIYILVVWEFGNFSVPLVIMAPIPLTLIGIIPGHWLLNAEFTATSMIGFIALAGIIVRNSILLVDFSIHEVNRGTDARDAVVQSCKTRTRPIIITALALVAGSSVILFDPIFQGMAISLLFGVLVSTLLTLVVIPLGCITVRSVFCPAAGPDGSGSGCAKATPTATTRPEKPLRERISGGFRSFALVAWAVLVETVWQFVQFVVALIRLGGIALRKLQARVANGASVRVAEERTEPVTGEPSSAVVTPAANTPAAQPTAAEPAAEQTTTEPSVPVDAKGAAVHTAADTIVDSEASAETSEPVVRERSEESPAIDEPSAPVAQPEVEKAAEPLPKTPRKRPSSGVKGDGKKGTASNRRKAASGKKTAPRKTSATADRTGVAKQTGTGQEAAQIGDDASAAGATGAKPKARGGRRGIRLKPGLGDESDESR